jgi:hypothetical protein
VWSLFDALEDQTTHVSSRVRCGHGVYKGEQHPYGVSHHFRSSSLPIISEIAFVDHVETMIPLPCSGDIEGKKTVVITHTEDSEEEGEEKEDKEEDVEGNDGSPNDQQGNVDSSTVRTNTTPYHWPAVRLLLVTHARAHTHTHITA